MPFDGTGSTEVTQVLIEGRRLIERGWCQGNAKMDDQFCLIGALQRGARSSEFCGEPYCSARNLLWEEIGRLGFSGHPVEFNDTPGRTKEEVLAVYDAAIADSFYPHREGQK